MKLALKVVIEEYKKSLIRLQEPILPRQSQRVNLEVIVLLVSHSPSFKHYEPSYDHSDNFGKKIGLAQSTGEMANSNPSVSRINPGKLSFRGVPSETDQYLQGLNADVICKNNFYLWCSRALTRALVTMTFFRQNGKSYDTGVDGKKLDVAADTKNTKIPNQAFFKGSSTPIVRWNTKAILSLLNHISSNETAAALLLRLVDTEEDLVLIGLVDQ
ncbi:hypothetical protein FF38_02408 [Lucilia cuprina]|uniref:Uncharacterized protein n=1 Tax=Lucilia cuprina TaxID=7375 RepID=A0A0L0CCX0_LUCCU|nr:hypothetical protein FF38_02408 [Lucilia cuprina]